MRRDLTLIVVVLYQSEPTQPIQERRTLLCFASALAARPELAEMYRLLLWDNSPEPSSGIELSVGFDYHHADINDGVSGAYNGALEICIRNQYEWMLLLDDDTEVSADYLAGMLDYRRKCNENDVVAAIAPLLCEGPVQLSPQQILTHRCVPVRPAPPRVVDETCFAANSGLMMRVSALAEIGGYSLDFWLDYSDIYVFHRLYAAGKRLYFAADLRLQHSMTMLDYDGRMTPARYENFLYAEQAFGDLYKTPSQNAVQLLRLLARIFRQQRYRNKTFSRMTLAFLWYRLTTSRVRRLENWASRKESRARQPHRVGEG